MFHLLHAFAILHLCAQGLINTTWLAKLESEPIDFIMSIVKRKERKPTSDINFLEIFETIDEFNPNPIIYKSTLPDAKDEECGCGVCSDFNLPKGDQLSNNINQIMTFDLTSFNYCQPCSTSSQSDTETSSTVAESTSTSELLPDSDPLYASTNYKQVAYMAYTKTKKTFALQAIGDSGRLLQLIVDTGASKACIQNKNEFTSLRMDTVDKELKGIASGISIQGEGKVSYDVINNFGKKVAQLCVNAYYCPDLEPGTRLLPPQSICFSGGVMGGCDAPGNTCEDGSIDHDIQATLYSYTKSGRGTLVKQNLINLPYNLSNNLPILNV